MESTESAETATLRQKVVLILKESEASMSYRELTNAIWAQFPEYKEHMHAKYSDEARAEQRIRLGTLVRDNPSVFTATKIDGKVMVGLAASAVDVAEDADEESAEDDSAPSVYWYTFPAYKKATGVYPIKIGKGDDPASRIRQQVTSMPEQPVILGTFPHSDASNLERALHCVLSLRGKRKADAPGVEWFLTTPDEISKLIQVILDKNQ